MTPKLKPPGTKRLTLKCDKLLSTSAFKCDLRRYISGPLPFTMYSLFTTPSTSVALSAVELGRRGLHSCTFQLNISRFCHLLHPMHPAYPKSCLR
jgi:hypothetical protein